jgi:mannose-1-phosphate guanylyltransferase
MIVPVILSGGSGTRLWPLSRKFYPKQYLSLVNKTTLFQDTIMRLPENVSDPLIICNEEHRFIVSEQLREIDFKHNGVILEPVGKNTAPAIAIAAMHLLNEKEDPTLIVLSADHLIKNHTELTKSIQIAKEVAKLGKIVTLGINPSNPEAGYGYIEVDKKNQSNYFNIVSFNEKPSVEVAKDYISSGKYFWNSGIFLFKASAYLEELKKFEPEIFNICEKTYNSASKDLDFVRLHYDQFHKCPDKSIDYAIMEKTKIGVTVPFKSSWKDIGSWKSLWESKSKDNNNNVIDGDVLLNHVKNSYIYSSNRLVSANNLSDVIIIDTQDALLVSSKNNSEDIKKIVKKLKNNNRSESENHRKVYRPWGYYDSIDIGNNFQVKRILVDPGAKLSLQKHTKRAEHWVIVKGIATITCGDKIFRLKENESTYIPKGTIHRLENNEKNPLEIIEIQTGSYLGEDDIIRLKDDYQRN